MHRSCIFRQVMEAFRRDHDTECARLVHCCLSLAILVRGKDWKLGQTILEIARGGAGALSLCRRIPHRIALCIDIAEFRFSCVCRIAEVPPMIPITFAVQPRAWSTSRIWKEEYMVSNCSDEARPAEFCFEHSVPRKPCYSSERSEIILRYLRLSSHFTYGQNAWVSDCIRRYT